MEISQSLVTLLSVVTGASLPGVGFFYRARVERKRTIALALADLLEVRHHVASIDVVLKAIRLRFEVPAEGTIILQTLIEQMSPANAELDKRYDSAISLLAGIDPLLAFNLRSKNTLPHLLNFIRNTGGYVGMPIEDISKIENTLRLNLAPHLDKAVTELAGKHSFLTKLRVKKLIAESIKPPSEINSMFDQLIELGVFGEQSPAK